MKNSKKPSILKQTLLILLFLAVSIAGLVPLLLNLNFGLDLQGGFEVLYKVNSIDSKAVTKDMVTSTYKTIDRRINGLGISEPNITIEGEDHIRVQLAGITDPEEARKMLSKTANLTFRDTSNNLLMTADVLKSGGAKLSSDDNGRPAVALSVKDKDKFYQMTRKVSEMKDNRIVIWLDFEDGDSFTKSESSCGNLSTSNCLSAATVSKGFASDVIIQGNFTKEQASNLVELINSGSLPTKLEEISSKTVGASFGEDSLNKTFVAGVIGVALIVILMTCIYRFAGFIASVGVMIYTFITFLVFWLVGGVLTLPGIAAVVIGIGMAVDANVINFARIKDELKNGSSLSEAFRLGNKNSFMTIFDSNFTTLLVAVILFIFGESSIKGFATMLIISIFVTMLVMVGITRWLLKIFVRTDYFESKTNFFIGVKPKDIPNKAHNEVRTTFEHQKMDFVSSRKWFYLGSVVIIIVGAIFIGTTGLKLGIDFKGGSSITLKAKEPLTEEVVKKEMDALKLPMQEFEVLKDNTVVIKSDTVLSKEQIETAEKHFSEKLQAETDIGVVSNIVKKEMIKNAIISLLLASIGIILYISFRFTFHYAVTSIIALLHDVFFMIAVFSILRLEVSSIFIAALLSIIGYSINDTIVTFDRIRENIKNQCGDKVKDEKTLKHMVNMSLRQTFNRSIITTLTTLIPVVCLLIFGSHEIFNFNIALLFGLISGVYSSLFIASQLWFDIEKRNVGKPIKKKWYELDEDDFEKKPKKKAKAS